MIRELRQLAKTLSSPGRLSVLCKTRPLAPLTIIIRVICIIASYIQTAPAQPRNIVIQVNNWMEFNSVVSWQVRLAWWHWQTPSRLSCDSLCRPDRPLRVGCIFAVRAGRCETDSDLVNISTALALASFKLWWRRIVPLVERLGARQLEFIGKLTGAAQTFQWYTYCMTRDARHRGDAGETRFLTAIH